MSKLVKGLVTEEMRLRYEGFASACVIDFTGMNVQEQEKLRTTLRAKKGRVQVVKNSIARRAFAGGPLEPLGKSLEGPCAVVVSTESAVDVAKTLMEAAKEFTKLTLKKAIFEGDPELISVEQLSKLKGRRELVGEIAGLVGSPGRALAGCLQSPQAKIAGCLKSLADKARS